MFEYESAIFYYKKSAEHASAGHVPEYEDQCMLKAADLMVLSQLDKFVDAIKEYEGLAARFLKTPTLRPLAKDTTLKTLLLYLAIDDDVGASRCMDAYRDQDPNFDGSREHVFVKDLINAISAKNIKLVEQVLYNYNKLTPFNKLLTKVLTKIKERIPPEGLAEGGLT